MTEAYDPTSADGDWSARRASGRIGPIVATSRVRGDPGDDVAVGVVDQVVAGQGVDEIDVLRSLERRGDGDQLPVPDRIASAHARSSCRGWRSKSAAITMTARLALVPASSTIQATAAGSSPIAWRSLDEDPQWFPAWVPP